LSRYSLKMFEKIVRELERLVMSLVLELKKIEKIFEDVRSLLREATLTGDESIKQLALSAERLMKLALDSLERGDESSARFYLSELKRLLRVLSETMEVYRELGWIR